MLHALAAREAEGIEYQLLFDDGNDGKKLADLRKFTNSDACPGAGLRRTSA